MSFFFVYPAATEIYTLSLHDALPILNFSSCEYNNCRERFGRIAEVAGTRPRRRARDRRDGARRRRRPDRKSTRLNSSHVAISYAVFCLKKKKPKQKQPIYSAR